jgi:hypothetical protein
MNVNRALEFAAVAAVAIALSVTVERWDRQEEIDAQVSAEIRLIEAYVDERRPVFDAAYALGQMAAALCGDYFAASQIVRVQTELQRAGQPVLTVCREAVR